jgi:ABC-type multidrug transport system fused ATPase/permease subunit
MRSLKLSSTRSRCVNRRLDLRAKGTNHIPQSLVSLRRIEKYLHGTEVAPVPPISDQSRTIAFQSATVTWPQDRSLLGSKTPSAASTPRKKFVLIDLSVNFPAGELSLICGKLGSGKTLLLLGTLLHLQVPLFDDNN